MSASWYYTKNLYLKFLQDDALFLASGLAFSLMICTIPLILIIFAIAGFALSGSVALWDNTVLYLQQIIPVSSERILGHTQSFIRGRKLIGIIGLVGLAFTATRLFAAVRTVLDCVFEVTHVRGIIHGKIFDFAMLLLLGMAIVFTNMALSLLPILFRKILFFQESLASLNLIFESHLFLIVSTFLLTASLLFISYKLFPTKKTRTDSCLIATSIAAVILELIKHIYSYYLSNYPEFNRIYGTLAAIIAMVIWFYLVSLVYIVAAEIAFLHEKRTIQNSAPG
ncbi:MAG: YihY/virulence factor BrkB family protein [Gemmatimonadota bacterium]|nr:YihY/virulence factor BrkB family protein [Gemmatimonadota bacterium]